MLTDFRGVMDREMLYAKQSISRLDFGGDLFPGFWDRNTSSYSYCSSKTWNSIHPIIKATLKRQLKSHFLIQLVLYWHNPSRLPCDWW